jgi:hypothetical protein
VLIGSRPFFFLNMLEFPRTYDVAINASDTAGQNSSQYQKPREDPSASARTADNAEPPAYNRATRKFPAAEHVSARLRLSGKANTQN